MTEFTTSIKGIKRMTKIAAAIMRLKIFKEIFLPVFAMKFEGFVVGVKAKVIRLNKTLFVKFALLNQLAYF